MKVEKDQEDLDYLQDNEDDEELTHLLHLLPLRAHLHLLHRDLKHNPRLKLPDDLKASTSTRRLKRVMSSKLGEERPTNYPTIF